MSYEYDVTQVALGSSPLEIVIGYDKDPIWVIIANNYFVGSTTGITVGLLPSPVDGPIRTVGYGSCQHFYLPQGAKWLSISGNGANITVKVADHDVPLEPVTVPAPLSLSVNGSVAAEIVGPIDGMGNVLVDIAVPRNPVDTNAVDVHDTGT
jgi:hypothetical protein